MNWDRIAGDWQSFKGKVRQKWAKLTDSDIESIGGKKDQLLGALRSRYGYEKEHADRELTTWLDSLKEPERGQAERPSQREVR